MLCDNSGSYGGEYEDASLLGYGAVMMQVVRTSETTVCFNETTQRYTPENVN
jgi:hypothetical protein